jgi:P27 family predicted phage terminase small subunit
MRGRKPTPTNLKILSGNPGKRKIVQEEIPVDPETPTPPEHMDEYALEEWNRIADGLNKMGILSSVDQSTLAAYCMACSRWRRAEEEIAELSKNPNSKGALVIKTVSGNYIQNPLIGIANKAAADMVRYAAEFGLTPSARVRLSINKDSGKESKFKDLIGINGGKK